MEEFIKYRLTKKKAIELTIELWKWLEENPEAHKMDWPLWRKYDYLDCGCSCCEFTKRKSKNEEVDKLCEAYCPLYVVWPYERKECEEMPCEYHKSPYAKWSRTFDLEEKRFYAREIWMNAEKILEDM